MIQTIGDGSKWSFLNGAWQDGPDGELLPPDGPLGEYMAVRHDASYSDFTATFRFRHTCVNGGVQLLFRVQDSRHYYALDVPINGQQSRSRHFWAGMVIAEGHRGDWFDGIGGVSIYAVPPGVQRVSPYYDEVAFAQSTRWGEMLAAYHEALA